MKKLISIVLTFTLIFLLTGCANSSDILITYSANEVTSFDTGGVSDSEEASFFAENLCIISDELNHMEDSNISATASFIVNASDNEVIFANDVYERMYPASLTKLITALVVFKSADLTDTVTISYNASHITESGAKLCGFSEGDKINLLSLLNCLLVYSGNDAGIAIAEHVGGSEEGFSNMMNETAKSIGAVHSSFINAHGLHNDNHYTTAYDLYLIFNELLSYDNFISIIDQTTYTADYENSDNQPITKEFTTTNRYLKGTEQAPEGITVIGGKTGTTSKAGSCLILYSKDSKNNDYISLLLQADGGNSLFSQMTNLLEMIE